MDISEEALNIAKHNGHANGVEINFILDSILNPQHTTLNLELLFDILVSNPPYICISEKESMNKIVLEYEPHLALFVDDNDPLLFYTKIADYALEHLNKNGKLYFEINPVYADELMEMLEKKGFKNVLILKDINNKNRILRCNI